MTISRTFLAAVVCLLFVAESVVVEAQILNSALPSSPEGVQPAVASAEVGEKDGGIVPTSWPSIPLPKITMPKLTMPKFSMPKLGLPKWPTNSDGIAASPFAPISAGAGKVTAGTKKAWEGTKEMFSFGDKSEATQPQVPAAAHAQPSLWQRMAGQQPEPTGPQTVAEWMSQPRVDP